MSDYLSCINDLHVGPPGGEIGATHRSSDMKGYYEELKSAMGTKIAAPDCIRFSALSQEVCKPQQALYSWG